MLEFLYSVQKLQRCIVLHLMQISTPSLCHFIKMNRHANQNLSTASLEPPSLYVLSILQILQRSRPLVFWSFWVDFIHTSEHQSEQFCHFKAEVIHESTSEAAAGSAVCPSFFVCLMRLGLWRLLWQPRHWGGRFPPWLCIATSGSVRDVTQSITSIIQSFVYKCNNSYSRILFY